MLKAPLKTCIARFNGTAVTKNAAKCLNLDKEKVECVIGLEIHAQLMTKTKLFSAARVDDAAASNSTVSDFDLGAPGTLPCLNKSCVQKSLSAALLLNCSIQDECRFDRKHYFYPDMPLGYQITQDEFPVAKKGLFQFYSSDFKTDSGFEMKGVRIKQIQLEMDSGKTIRANPTQLYVDLNRAGVGLIEIVTEPDLNSPAEAASFVDQLRLILMHNQICAGELHKGNMRVDANVSLKINGQSYPRTELKNISSIRLLKTSIENELTRQKKLLEDGKEIETVTLNLDDDGEIIVVREKGDSLDYRFTPEPNLPRLRIEKQWVDNAKSSLKQDADHLVFIQQHGMVPSRAIDVVKDERLHAFVKATLLQVGTSVEFYLEWLKQLQIICANISEKYPPTDPLVVSSFPKLVYGFHNGLITKLTCIELMKLYLQQKISEDADVVMSQKRFRRLLPDDSEFILLVKQVVADNDKLVEKYKKASGSSKQKSFNKIRNLLMTVSDKRISLKDAERSLLDLLT